MCSYQAGLAHPLGLARGDELIDDALGGVGEVTELRLPQDEVLRGVHVVAELEAEDGVCHHNQQSVKQCVYKHKRGLVVVCLHSDRCEFETVISG